MAETAVSKDFNPSRDEFAALLAASPRPRRANPAEAKDSNPSRDEFAALLAESLAKEDLFEGSVVKGKIVGIEKGPAVSGVGLKAEGRGALREFSVGGKADLKIGDEVEVYLERVENALGEAVLSRDKGRRAEGAPGPRQAVGR